jgi:hypothetical protein
MIKKSSDILDELMHLQEHGHPPGYGAGHKSLDEILTFVKGGSTDITGYPYYGKSLVLKEIMVGLAVNQGWSFLAYMGDDGMDIDVLSNLLHKITGKTFLKGYANSISKKDITKTYLGLSEMIKFVPATNKMEPMEFWELGKELKVNGTVIDSWNYMNHKGSPTDPNYIRDILSDRNIFMEANEMHSFTIIHPKNADPKANKDGSITRPSVYDYMGGSEWNNLGRNLVIVHKNSKDNHEPYHIHVDKVKPKRYGNAGMATLWLDWPKQKFYTREIAEGEVLTKKTYAYGDEKIEIHRDPLVDMTFEVDDKEPF